MQGTLPPLMPALARFAPHALAGLSCVLAALGCQPKIGDPCSRAIDCGLRVVRQCDLSNKNRDPDNKGECTLENCSYGVCPKNSTCVKVYATEFLSVACDPLTEDQGDDQGTDACESNEVCLPEGLCADEIRARTSCRRTCDSDSDCRDNYHCVSTGIDGVYVAPDPEDPTVQHTANICVPRP